MDDLEELRRLLLNPEREQLRELHERLEDKEQRARDVSGVLPDAIRLNRGRGDELARALQPSVQSSIKETIEKRPQIFVELLHPIVGEVVRRSIRQALRGMLQTLNKTLEHTFSWQGLKWRFEALRTGRSFANVVMLRSMEYRVEQVFLFHRETSLSLLQVAADAAQAQDSDMMAGMLSAIQDFGRDALKTESGESLDFRLGEKQVWLVPGPHAYLAAVIHGTPTPALRTVFEEAIESIHVQKGSALAKFDGDASVFEPLRPELEACLQNQLKTKAADAHPTRALLALTTAAAAIVAVGLLWLRHEERWRDFLRRLDAEPGIAVTSAERRWFSPPRVTGLRDPLAADPVGLARAANVDAARVRFDWKDYLALDPVSVQRRFEQRFGLPAGARAAFSGGTLELAGAAPHEWIERVRREAPLVAGINALAENDVRITYDPALVLERFENAFPLPPGVTARVADGTLQLAGTAPYEWIAPVRAGVMRLPGITALSEKELAVAFDPARVLQRFTDRFGLPDTLNANLQNGALILSGEAAHGWLARVRQGAMEVPGIASLDDRNVVDLDLRTYQQAKSVIESAFIYFLLNKDNFATEGFAALSRLPDELRRCETAAKRIGVDIAIEVRGYADAVGNEAKNIDLSQRRANAVRDFLISCGLDGAMLMPLGLGQPSTPSPEAKPLPEQADRRVAFRVLADLSAARP